jgi:aryl-alcohol dehydrogenase-like predicted oxidoreductase
MDYRTLGRTGVKVSALAMGTDNFSDTPNKPTRLRAF